MARIYPFRALRYNPSRVRLEDVVTQPWDKITPSMQQAYYQRSPYNLVRIILGLPELFDGAPADDGKAQLRHLYPRGPRLCRLARPGCAFARERALYLRLLAAFHPPRLRSDATMERRGFIALGELYDYSQGVVFRHEQTLAKPMSDRLNLLRATRAHFGQIFMLYSDPAQTAERLLFGASSSDDFEVTDEYGVLHRISRISDPPPSTSSPRRWRTRSSSSPTATIATRPRSPTPTNTRPKSPPAPSVTPTLPQPPYPEAAAMMTFVNMDSEGLVILPTHRVVFGLKEFSQDKFLEARGRPLRNRETGRPRCCRDTAAACRGGRQPERPSSPSPKPDAFSSS